MLIFPAIDIKDGCVVRLVQGRFQDKTVYSKDPVKTAKHWVKQGACYLHIVDLDGAQTGVLVNTGIVKEIVQSVNVPVEVGGGIRSVQSIKKVLGCGVTRVVLGTRAAEDRVFLRKARDTFKDKIIISVDAKDGLVQVNGWDAAASGIEAVSFGCDLKKIGFNEIIYTDISKDGMLKGPNIKGMKAMLKGTGLHIIGSGGVGSLEDILKLKELVKSGLTGIIVGKALYEGRFTLSQALKILN